MKIINLKEDNDVYSSNVYLVRGTWNTLEDINTLVDVGRDPLVIDHLKEAHTGTGQKKVGQVILTHSHYDHVSNLPLIKEAFYPVVYAFSSSLEGVDHVLRDGEILKMGDREFEVIYTPGHSSDSICLYCNEEGVLFVGDTPVLIDSDQSSYEKAFLWAFESLCHKDVKSIYFGHRNPLFEDCNARLHDSLKKIKHGRNIRVIR